MTPDHSNASEGESRRLLQSIGLVVCSCLSVVLAMCFVVMVLVRNEARGAYTHEKLNPNTAPVGSLIRLPGIGLTRARAIAAYRDAVCGKTGGVAFRRPEDLERIKGIGPKTAQDIADWLEFSSSAFDDSASPVGEQPRP